jgi:O-antigen/teichoic acid export membrane protein
MNIHTVVYVNQLTDAKTVQDRNKIAIPLISLSVVTTMVTAGVMLSVSDVFGDFVGLPTVILVHIFLQILFQIPVNFWMMKQRHTYAYMPLLRFSVAMTLCNALLGMLFVWMSSGDRAAARVVSVSVVQAIVGGMLYIGFIKTEKQCFSTRGWKHTLAVQLPLIPHGLASNVLYSADRIMINSLVGATEAGIYSLAYSHRCKPLGL